jgi:hypothetical protein
MPRVSFISDGRLRDSFHGNLGEFYSQTLPRLDIKSFHVLCQPFLGGKRRKSLAINPFNSFHFTATGISGICHPLC